MRYCQASISQGQVRIFYVTQDETTNKVVTNWTVDYDLNERLIFAQDQIDWLINGEFRRLAKVISINKGD